MLSPIGTESIQTDRLFLRSFKISDAEEIFNNWAKGPKNVEHLSW